MPCCRDLGRIGPACTRSGCRYPARDSREHPGRRTSQHDCICDSRACYLEPLAARPDPPSPDGFNSEPTLGLVYTKRARRERGILLESRQGRGIESRAGSPRAAGPTPGCGPCGRTNPVKYGQLSAGRRGLERLGAAFPGLHAMRKGQVPVTGRRGFPSSRRRAKKRPARRTAKVRRPGLLGWGGEPPRGSRLLSVTAQADRVPVSQVVGKTIRPGDIDRLLVRQVPLRRVADDDLRHLHDPSLPRVG